MVNDPALYRWSSYRHNVLGQTGQRLQHHPLYLALVMTDDARRTAYRDLFRSELDEAVITDVRLALSQDQSLESEKFKEAMCAATGVGHTQPRRGRPNKHDEILTLANQTDFGFQRK